ncbi:hypothetical protein CXF92_12610 [Pseudomonas sp. Choline-3u-10]|uniref:DUF7696 family protein n=1 Tax=Pseudomonas sp. Choline-3u-10 TaxID=2058311 RepID=UPI000C33431E|nr:hypothetical protein [Pseudomonas sp. Choline-3u-10]PKG93617.1 hypothetical protein CXF92_12610 [Pseudomonas sp. Choline-3u-10]
MADDVRQVMQECEARTWLRKGYSTPERIKELTELIAKKRGQASAEGLVDEMRRQWRRRSEWLT